MQYHQGRSHKFVLGRYRTKFPWPDFFGILYRLPTKPYIYASFSIK